MDFLKEIVKEIGDEYTQIAADIDETERFIDTGSHIFNAVVSGSIYGCLLYTSPSPRDGTSSRMPSSA